MPIELDFLLPPCPGLKLTQLYVHDQQLILIVTSTNPVACCPVCQTASRQVHCYYTRTLTDLGWADFQVQLKLLEEEDRVVMQAYAAAKPEPLHQLVAMGKAFIEWGLSHPQECAFCFLRVQLETLIQGKSATSMGERPQSSDLILLNLIHELRRDYPVRQIADAALLSMIMGLVSRVAIDQTALVQ